MTQAYTLIASCLHISFNTLHEPGSFTFYQISLNNSIMEKSFRARLAHSALNAVSEIWGQEYLHFKQRLILRPEFLVCRCKHKIHNPISSSSTWLSAKLFIPLKRDIQEQKKKGGKKGKIINKLQIFHSNLFLCLLNNLFWLGAGIKDLPGACLVFLRDEATGGSPTCVRSTRMKHKKVNWKTAGLQSSPSTS